MFASNNEGTIMARASTPRPKSGRVKLRRKKLSDGSESLYLDIYNHGVRSYEFLKLYLTGDRASDAQTLRIADVTRTRRELQLSSAAHDVRLVSSDEDFIDFFASSTALRPYANYRSALRHLKDFAGARFPMRMVRKEWARQYRDYLIEVCRKSNTAVMYWCCFRVVVNDARSKDLIVGDPLAGVAAPKREEGERPFLTIEELRAIAHAKPRHANVSMHEEVRRAFLFACYTGLRLGDVKHLTWSKLANDRVSVRMIKTNDIVVVPLSDEAKALIGKKGDPDGLVFNLSTQSVTWRHVRRWAETAGIHKPIGFHTARHTFATMALTHGVDIFVVSKLLGHRNVRQTQVYATLVDERRDGAIALLPRL